VPACPGNGRDTCSGEFLASLPIGPAEEEIGAALEEAAMDAAAAAVGVVEVEGTPASVTRFSSAVSTRVCIGEFCAAFCCCCCDDETARDRDAMAFGDKGAAAAAEAAVGVVACFAGEGLGPLPPAPEPLVLNNSCSSCSVVRFAAVLRARPGVVAALPAALPPKAARLRGDAPGVGAARAAEGDPATMFAPAAAAAPPAPDVLPPRRRVEGVADIVRGGKRGEASQASLALV